ncbi:conserved protein of unknown function [Ectopseudomonas oleovorans]|uniref:Uncharacterized protein n=1 Tax=Ectopseudomonas oleovorans TaxID=301 RepID=A0A653B374_ECTOL|nr:conserved protein of unknown function [Pseudomonas oleovorans]
MQNCQLDDSFFSRGPLIFRNFPSLLLVNSAELADAPSLGATVHGANVNKRTKNRRITCCYFLSMLASRYQKQHLISIDLISRPPSP